MSEEIRNQGSDSATEKAEDLKTEAQAEPQSGTESQAAETITNNHIAQKRGRMIAAGVVATVILAVVAVVVAGIFQFTAGWLIKCPGDLPVNDPAPILWKDVVNKETQKAPLGVPDKLAKQAAWKGAPAADQ
jgi:hypothetical protein